MARIDDIPKTYDRRRRPRGCTTSGSAGCVRAATRRAERPVLDRHPAAEHHRHPAHGARAQQHAPGRADPLQAHGRATTRCGCRARTTRASRRSGWSSASCTKLGLDRRDDGPRSVRREGVAVEGRGRRLDHEAAAEPRRVVRLAARALHDGRGPLEGRARDVRALLRRGAHLPRTERRSTGIRSA